MGGKAFATHDPPLHVPRLTPLQYFKLRDILIQRLSVIFELVAVPIEAPEKNDHGDIDIIVSGPKGASQQGQAHRAWRALFSPDDAKSSQEPASKPTVSQNGANSERTHPDAGDVLSNPPQASFASQVDAIANCLGASARAGPSFAVPVDQFALSDSDFEAGSHAQVDVDQVPADLFDWHFFTRCHGDFFQIIGPSLRSLGLVISRYGFYAVNRDIEPHDRKRARTLLTTDPIKVLEFLRLDPCVFYGTTRLADVYRATMTEARPGTDSLAAIAPEERVDGDSQLQGTEGAAAYRTQSKSRSECSTFVTETQLFEYAERMRGFDPGTYRSQGTKAQDRRRLNNRTGYRDFVTSYLPGRYPALFEDSRADRRLDHHDSSLSGLSTDVAYSTNIPEIGTPAGANGAPTHSSSERGGRNPPKQYDGPADPRSEAAGARVGRRLSREDRDAIRTHALQAFDKAAEWRAAASSWAAHVEETERARLAKDTRRSNYIWEAEYAGAWIQWLVARKLARGGQ